MSGLKTAAKVLTIAGTAAVGAFAWGTLVERKMYTIREHELPILPIGAKPLRILHISDLHLAPWQQDKIDWVKSLTEIRPDLIVCTGDIFGAENALEAVRESLSPFAGTPGVFVNGSNDYWGPVFKNPLSYFSNAKVEHDPAALDVQGLTDFFTKGLGWLDLNNDAGVMDFADMRLEFIGVDDPHIERDDTVGVGIALEDLREERLEPEESLGAVTIGVTHAPYQRVLNAFTTQGAKLILAGHTHGGQVRIPGLSAAPVTNCDIPKDYARGLHVWHHARRASFLNVSAGLGTSIYAPFRFGCLPEVSLITLTAQDEDEHWG